MNIGIFDPYLDDLGGGEKYMMSIAECFAKSHKVTIFWDNKKDIEILKKRFLLDLSGVTIQRNIFVPSVSFFERLLITRNFDAIYILSDGSIPLVSTKLFVHFQQPLQHIKSISAKTRFKLSRINAVFCNSKFTKSFIDKTFHINSKVIYPPISLYPEDTKKENIILNVGRLRVKSVTADEYKKQSFMIEVFKEMINNRIENWKFVLAVSVRDSERAIFERLKKKAEGFPISFVVNKNNKELWDLYNKSKIYWHASGYGENLQSHPEYAEHFGISTVEAMGAGAVPVVINAGGQKEIVDHSKNGFLWDEPQDLFKKTKLLIEDVNLWSRMAKEAQKRAMEFSKANFCKKIKDLT